MQLKPFLLNAWLDQYEHDIEFNLAASTGPTWTVNDILLLADDETRHRFLNHNVVYRRPAGADSLREAIAEMQRLPVETVQIVTGASGSAGEGERVLGSRDGWTPRSFSSAFSPRA
jgi:hypothetical protein